MLSLKILAQAIVRLAVDLCLPVRAAHITSCLRSVFILRIASVYKIAAKDSSKTVATSAPHVHPHVLNAESLVMHALFATPFSRSHMLTLSLSGVTMSALQVPIWMPLPLHVCHVYPLATNAHLPMRVLAVIG